MEVSYSDKKKGVKIIANRKRTGRIFTLSLIITLCCLCLGDGIRKHMVYERMLSYSKATSRAGDHAENHVVMNGVSGCFGGAVYLKYLEDGYIQLSGDNIDGERGWKLLSRFTLEPGTYTLTGMSGVPENTIALQLHISDNTSFTNTSTSMMKM